MKEWSRNAAVKRTRTRINKMRGAVIANATDIAGDWSDQDRYIVSLCDDLISSISTGLAALAESLVPEDAP